MYNWFFKQKKLKLRFLETITTKGKTVTDRKKILQYWNGWWWEDVPSETVTKEKGEDGRLKNIIIP